MQTEEQITRVSSQAVSTESERTLLEHTSLSSAKLALKPEGAKQRQVGGGSDMSLHDSFEEF